MSETVSTAAREAEVKRHRKENFKATLRVFFGRGILSKVCFVILVAFILVAVIGPFLLSDPYSQSVLQKLSDPSQEHFLGTDQLGPVLSGVHVSVWLRACCPPSGQR